MLSKIGSQIFSLLRFL